MPKGLILMKWSENILEVATNTASDPQCSCLFSFLNLTDLIASLKISHIRASRCWCQREKSPAIRCLRVWQPNKKKNHRTILKTLPTEQTSELSSGNWVLLKTFEETRVSLPQFFWEFSNKLILSCDFRNLNVRFLPQKSLVSRKSILIW